jgi:hypothetical protein
MRAGAFFARSRIEAPVLKVTSQMRSPTCVTPTF